MQQLTTLRICCKLLPILMEDLLCLSVHPFFCLSCGYFFPPASDFFSDTPTPQISHMLGLEIIMGYGQEGKEPVLQPIPPPLR
ncbi:hypothetical protein CEXT_493041 [Caerostris extrusa]|uniref:Uncharacterized protein n=1 Tax=Caerostris extrusa TaxID=172846 RepID=A0AAV4T2D1_CAEEX|nr:hypothetical protein CEXT_493041 [Caerostris extrusa]